MEFLNPATVEGISLLNLEWNLAYVAPVGQKKVIFAKKANEGINGHWRKLPSGFQEQRLSRTGMYQ